MCASSLVYTQMMPSTWGRVPSTTSQNAEHSRLGFPSVQSVRILWKTNSQPWHPNVCTQRDTQSSYLWYNMDLCHCLCWSLLCWLGDSFQRFLPLCIGRPMLDDIVIDITKNIFTTLSRFLPWRDGIWLVMKRHEKVHSEFVRNRVL